MADDNSATDAESPADRQHAFTELSELLIKGSAVLAVAGFLFTQARTTIDQGGAWIAMGLTMTLATILVAVLGVATFSRVIARFVSLILSDPGDSLFKRLVAVVTARHVVPRLPNRLHRLRACQEPGGDRLTGRIPRTPQHQPPHSERPPVPSSLSNARPERSDRARPDYPPAGSIPQRHGASMCPPDSPRQRPHHRPTAGAGPAMPPPLRARPHSHAPTLNTAASRFTIRAYRDPQ